MKGARRLHSIPMSTLIYTADMSTSSTERNRLYRDLHRGRLVKVAPGAFLDAQEWARLKPSGRYRMECKAISHSHRLTGRSLMTLLGLEHWPLPKEIDICHASRGHRGLGLVLPSGTRLRIHQWEGESVEYPGSITGAPLDQAFLTALAQMDFESGLVLADGFLRTTAAKGGLQYAEDRRGEILALLDASSLRVGRSTVRSVLEAATPLSESVGESRSLALFHAHGLPLPLLQQEIPIPSGGLFRPDYLWPDVNVVGEFDGKVKYGEHVRPGETPQDVALRERRREKLLQQMGYTVVRWDWDDLNHPARILSWLAAAGVR